MAEWMKRGADAAAGRERDQRVRGTVEAILRDIEARGDAAVRELSERFDGWSPPTFRLGEADIERCLSELSRRDLDDIRFAQEQVRGFARHQRASMHEVEV